MSQVSTPAIISEQSVLLAERSAIATDLSVVAPDKSATLPEISATLYRLVLSWQDTAILVHRWVSHCSPQPTQLDSLSTLYSPFLTDPTTHTAPATHTTAAAPRPHSSPNRQTLPPESVPSAADCAPGHQHPGGDRIFQRKFGLNHRAKIVEQPLGAVFVKVALRRGGQDEAKGMDRV